MSITPEIDLESYDTPRCPECFSEIDTWAVEKRAVERERERIIKVLNTAKGTDCGCNDCKGVHNYIDLLVDLIQGKNK